jgi:hypothetical protein
MDHGWPGAECAPAPERGRSRGLRSLFAPQKLAEYANDDVLAGGEQPLPTPGTRTEQREYVVAIETPGSPATLMFDQSNAPQTAAMLQRMDALLESSREAALQAPER